jgi:hypothetical protein
MKAVLITIITLFSFSVFSSEYICNVSNDGGKTNAILNSRGSLFNNLFITNSDRVNLIMQMERLSNGGVSITLNNESIWGGSARLVINNGDKAIYLFEMDGVIAVCQEDNE